MIIIKKHFTICLLLFLFLLLQIPFLAGCETLHMGDGYVVHDDAEAMRFAWFWFNNQNYDQAKKMADVALGINSLNSDACNILGLIELRNNSIEKSIEYFEKAVHIGGDEDVPILHNLGFAYFKSGDYKKSIEIFNTSLRKKSNCLAKLGIAMSLYKLHNNDLKEVDYCGNDANFAEDSKRVFTYFSIDDKDVVEKFLKN